MGVEASDGRLKGLGEGEFDGLFDKGIEDLVDDFANLVGVGGDLFDNVDNGGGTGGKIILSVDNGVTEVVDLKGGVDLPVHGSGGIVGGLIKVFEVFVLVLVVEDDLVNDGGIDN